VRECPYCLVATRVESEAPFAGYGLKRVHRCRGCQRTFDSVELPASVVKSIGEKQTRAAIGAFGRGVRRAVEAAKRADLVNKMTTQGIAPYLVAHALGVTSARVRQIRAAARRAA
jgi:transcriptional regulator NrdR family protein